MRRLPLDNVATQPFPRRCIDLLDASTTPVQGGRITFMMRFADEGTRKVSARLR
jgi:hypothetical protein